ncbi:MaoC family dehydratase [Colwellia demingiae]|uniref:MaoC family dehydratase n=1 Tax=Colwellia demingiae TaxID=89401 RepID=A0A5C6QGE2_9GAMM|nr:MaoC family dehydratase [Colwellia demingiae]TWX68116.1 MaoC family dehydratase [Colwellia demingiae]
MKFISLDNLYSEVGIKAEPTSWFTITQEQINAFADCTHDQQFIHVDPQKAAKTPFGSTIAHGFLTLSMLSHFTESFSVVIEGTYMSVNYGMDNQRFISPVKVGKRIRAHATLIEVIEKKKGQFMLKTAGEIETEHEKKPALVAESIAMQMVK